MGSIDQTSLDALLTATADSYREPATLILLGGCALALLGSRRPTPDIDYVDNALDRTMLQLVIMQIAKYFRMSSEK